MTLEYFRLVDRLVAPWVPGPWQHRIVARRFQGDQPRALGQGGRGHYAFSGEAAPASADTWDRTWLSDGDPERDAYEALVRIYALFGLDVATNHEVTGDRVPEEQWRS